MRIDTPVQPGEGLHRISYAQNAEDILLDRLFRGRPGTYMDVGANHPYLDSNTYFFYVRGWRGVNVEPSRQGHALFLEHRPRDLNLNLAASDAEGELPFHEITGGEGPTGLSTLSPAMADEHRAQGYQVEEYRVPVKTVAQLIDEYHVDPPDFLSIDVESHEAQVLRGIPLARWRPRVLVIEATAPLTEAESYQTWEPLLTGQGYVFAAFNGVNRFYLRDDLRDQLDCFATPVNVLDHYQRQETIYYLHKLEQLQVELETARFHFEQERGGWAWAQTQARHAQAVWKQEIAEFEKQRAFWTEMNESFERARAAWEQDKQDLIRRLHDLEAARATLENERQHVQHMLAETQDLLRPYQVVDRLGVVRAGFGLARKIKRKLAS